jgi:nucleoredoxin
MKCIQKYIFLPFLVLVVGYFTPQTVSSQKVNCVCIDRHFHYRHPSLPYIHVYTMTEPTCEGGVCSLPTVSQSTNVADSIKHSDDKQPLSQRSAQPVSELFEQLFSGDIHDHQGNVVPPSASIYADEQGRRPLLGLYFTASWCPPCQQFSPVLHRFTTQHKDDFQVIVISHDHDQDAVQEYLHNKQGWFTVPFADFDRRRKLARLANVQMIPTLIIVDPYTGETISTWGRSAILKNPDGCLQEWRQGRSGVSWWQLIRPW